MGGNGQINETMVNATIGLGKCCIDRAKRYAELKDKIKALVEQTKPHKSADELLAAYAGREEDLARNLRKMRAKQDFKAEVEALVAKTKPGKATDELLAAYVGREDELVSHLQKLSASK